jgi:hypothetical protein
MDVYPEFSVLNYSQTKGRVTPPQGLNMKAKILNSCAGQGISYYAGQIVEITKRNSDVIHSKVRHGTAVLIEEKKKETPVLESRESNEDTNLLHDEPAKPKSYRRIGRTERG